MDRLCDLLVREVPVGFWKSIRDRYPVLYKEAHSRAFGDPTIAKHSARFLRPFFRLGLVEQVFMDSAARMGMPVRLEWNKSRNYQYALVELDHVEITTNSATSPYDPPKDTVYRRQKALINRYIPQLQLGFLQIPQGAITQRLYATVLHCQDQYDPSKHWCTYIQFPAADNESWVAKYKIEELIALYSGLGVHSAQPDKAHPTFKKTDADEGEGDK